MADHAPTCPALEGGACACPWSAPVTSAAELRALVEAAPDWDHQVGLRQALGRAAWIAEVEAVGPVLDEEADALAKLLGALDRPTLLRLVQLWEAAEALEVAFKASPDVSGLVGSLGRVRNALAALRGDEGT